MRDKPLPNPIDLGRLTPSEREILSLLARGHTVKSAASETGLSEHTVNDRLRQARQKTGAASSRELARLFATQENLRKEFGADTDDPSVQDEPAKLAPIPARRRKMGMLSMAIIGTAAAIVLALASVQPERGATTAAAPARAAPERGTDSDDLALKIAARSKTNLAELAAQVRSEPRDADWAGSTEARLRAIYGSIPLIDGPENPLHVRCAATLCEVSGMIWSHDRQDGINAAMRAMQNGPRIKSIIDAGLWPLETSFQGGHDFPRMAFVVYWRKQLSGDHPAPDTPA